MTARDSACQAAGPRSGPSSGLVAVPGSGCAAEGPDGMGGKGNKIGGGAELGLGDKNARAGAAYGSGQAGDASWPGGCGAAADEAPTAGDA